MKDAFDISIPCDCCSNCPAHFTPTKPTSKRSFWGAWSYFCPQCGLPVQRNEDVNFCGTCGKRLDWRGLT